MTIGDYRLSPPDPPEHFDCWLCGKRYSFGADYGGTDERDDFCLTCWEQHEQSRAEQAEEE